MPGLEQKFSRLPVDQGWAWIIMTGHFVMTLVMVGYGRALSVFLTEFVVMFQSSLTAATLSYAVMTAAYGIGNVVVTYILLPRFDTRHVILTGATIGSVAIVVSSLAPTITFMVFMHSVIGFSQAMMYTASATLMGPYFHRLRGVANAVSNTGLSVSAIVIPPLTQFLITSYGTRGALLLMAGFQMQGVVAGCLMRPVELYTSSQGKKGKRCRCLYRSKDSSNLQKREIDGKETDDAAVAAAAATRSLDVEDCRKDTSESEMMLKQFSEQSCENGTHVKGEIKGVKSEEGFAQDRPSSKEVFDDEALLTKSFSNPRLDLSDTGQHLASTLVQHHHQSIFSPKSSGEKLRERLKDSIGFTENVIYCSHEENTVSNIPRPRVLHELSEGDSLPAASDHDFKKAEMSGRLPIGKDTEANSFEVETRCIRNMTRQNNEDGKTESIETSGLGSSLEERPQTAMKKGWRGFCLSMMSQLMVGELFRNWCFLLIMIYFPLGQTNAFLAIFLPDLAVERGLTRDQAVLLLSVMGGVDLVCRLLLGALADTGLVRRTRIVATALAVLSAACMMVSFYTTFGRLSAFSVVFGLCGGANQNTLIVIVVELLGLSHLNPTLGSALLLQSFFLSVSHPILGALVDWTGSNAVVYYFVGGCLAIAVVVLLTEPLARKLESRRKPKKNEIDAK